MTTIRGMTALKAKLARLKIAAPAIAGAAADVIADGVAEDARGYAPVDTGRLRDSIAVTSDGDVSSDVGYDVPVEFGSDDTPSQPFMRPAADGAIRHVPAAAAKAKAAVEVVV